MDTDITQPMAYLYRHWKPFQGCPTGLELQGGLHPLLSEAEYTHRISFMQRLMAQPGMADYRWELLDHQALRSLVPQIGPKCSAIHTAMEWQTR